MRTQIEEMSLRSAFAWIVVAVAASVATLVLTTGFGETQAVALSVHSMPLIA